MNIQMPLPLRSLLRQRTRYGIAVSAIGVGVIAFLIAGGFIEWVFWAMRESLVQNRLGHIQVVRPGFLEQGTADPFSFLFPEQSKTAELIERQKGLKVLAPRLVFTGLISKDDNTTGVIGEGMDPLKERAFDTHLAIAQGDGLKAEKQDGIILGTGLADSIGAHLGDKVVLLANKSSGGINALEAEVIGIFTTANKAFDDYSVRVPLSFAQRLIRVSGVHKWIVLLEDTEQTPEFLTLLQTTFSNDLNSLQFVPWYDMADFYHKTVTLYTRQLNVVGVIIAFLIVLGISNTMMMTVTDRTSEIGTLMALGLRRRQVLALFLSESAWLGAIGGGLGVMIGYGLAALISKVGIPMPPAPGMDVGYRAEILVSLPLLAKSYLIALGTTILAGVVPAFSASRMVITDALRAAR